MNQNSVLGTVTRPWTGQFGVRILAGARDFSLPQHMSPAPGPTQPPIQQVEGFFPRGKPVTM
jgi:hypothetical protein